jgi:exosortase/archaeosortase family protein
MTTPQRNAEKSGLRDRKFPRVVFSFIALAVFLDLLVWYFGRKEYLAFFDIFTAWVTTGMVHISGLQAVRDSNVISLANTVWVVSIECTAIFIMIIYASFLVIYPAPVKAKALGLLSGLPFIFCANILRLFIMAWIDALRPEFSEYFHNYAWQGVFIIMVIFMWVLWIEKAAVPARCIRRGDAPDAG